MFKKLFKEVLNEEVLSCELTSLGITNNIFLVTTNNNTYLVRKPKKDNLNNYLLEKEIEQLIEHLEISIHPIYIGADGIKITLYNSSIKTFDTFNLDERLKVPVELLKKLHGAKLQCSINFDHTKKLNDYRYSTDKQLYDVSMYLYILDDIKHLEYEPILCHNDLVEGNICIDNNHSYLIDYEYASNNDPYFDVMSFLTENTLTNEEIKSFITNYFDVLDNTTIQHLKTWETYHNLLWYYWANMMYHNTNETIFHTIATDKYNALHTSIL